MIIAFQLNAFQNDAFQVSDTIVYFDTHDGGKRRKDEEKYRKQEAAKAKARRDEILALFELIVEGKPRIAEEIAEPFVLIEATIEKPAVIDYEAMLSDIARVEQIYHAYIEMDDEEVLALL
jgi:hypothetical protein